MSDLNCYIINAADYPSLPEMIFHGHDVGNPRYNNDNTKLVARCATCTAGNGCLSWMSTDEVLINHQDILIELKNPEWNNLEE